ncbi:MAG: hypothetical protein JWL75_510, partial [Parcubacteria group bacterium]|nr:hypothetical protein [Parcubacteria group bacterium]
ILATKADPSAGLTSAGPDGTGGANDGSGSAAGGSSGLDKAKAASFLISHYGGNNSSGHGCLAAIQLALQASGGGSLLCPGQGVHHWAGTCGPLLTGKGYSSLGGSDQSPQVGDIIVVPGNKYSAIGHIAMYTPSGWISDFAQGVNGNPYPSPKPPAQYYRP